MNNEYLNKFSNLPNGWNSFHFRTDFVREYAWAIPNQTAIREIVKHSPLIEIGAGTGYWAKLISEAGGNIIAFDKKPPSSNKNEYRHTKMYFNVQRGRWSKIKKHPDRTLFLCWPPYKTRMASDCLKTYKGNSFIFIGESWGGCNGDDEFWDIVNSNWEMLNSVDIPKWSGMHDYLMVFKRK